MCVLSPVGDNSNPRFCSRAEALQSFKKSPFFATWDPLSLELYAECQLWENRETGEAKLKMSGTWVGGHAPPIHCFVVLIVLHRRAQCSPLIVDHSRRGIFYHYLMSGLP